MSSRLSIFFFVTLTCAQATAEPEIKFYQRLRLDTTQVKPAQLSLGPLGGISAIVFIESEKNLVLLSDDRGEKGEPRAFEYSVEWASKKKISLDFRKQLKLKSPDKNVDYEGLALLPWGNFLIASEGDQNYKPRVAPALMDFRRDGQYVRHYDLPKAWLPNTSGKLTKGIRNNRGLEGLAASPSGSQWVLAVENHLQASDPKVTEMAVYHSPEAWVIREKSRFLYPIDIPEQAVMAHGVSEVIFKNEHKLWVLERNFGSDLKFSAKLYELDLLKASDAGMKAAVTKKFVFDLGKAALDEMKDQTGFINFEGLAWGPSLPTGERLLLVASDNNFLPLPTELWVFSVKDEAK